MKAVALSLLLAAAVIYLLTFRLDHAGVWGYVNTAAEAAMVGAMADWFAVTALFRHPLGVPIPHTAIIPRKKDELAGSLQSFFADNFLTEKVVRERLASAHLARRLGVWLQDEAHARRLVVEAVRLLKTALNKVDDEDVLAGRFKVCTPDQILEECRLLIEHLDVDPLHFTSNHASNYLPLKGGLPEEREKFLSLLDEALAGKIRLRKTLNRGI